MEIDMPQISRSRRRESKRVSLKLDTKGGADQAGREVGDISSFVAAYRRNGVMPAVKIHQPLWGDFTGPTELHEMREAVFRAREMFEELPASVRDLCRDDEANLLDLVSTPEGQIALRDAGLEFMDDSGALIPDPRLPDPRDPLATPQALDNSRSPESNGSEVRVNTNTPQASSPPPAGGDSA
jgi:hypothetical protein